MQGGSPCAPFSPVSILEQKMNSSIEGVMNSSIEGVSTTKQSSLNPNAAEFIPSALRGAPGNADNTDVFKLEATENCGKAVLNRTESTISSTSDDEETRKYWRTRLPDDITPDFGEDALQDSEGFLSGSLTGHGYPRGSKSEGVMESGQLAFDKMSQGVDVSFPNGKSKFAFHQHAEGRSGGGMAPLSASSGWDQHIMGHDQQLSKNRDGYFSADECDVGFLNGLVGEQALSDNADISHVEILASEFPGFAAESLADIYYANGGDLGMTIEMLTQLELQDDAGSQQSFHTRTSSAPNLTSMDFPALTPEMLNGLSQYTDNEVQQAVNTFRRGEADKLFFGGRSISGTSRTATDFATVVRKSASDSGQWKYDKNGAMDGNLGSSRNPQVSSGSSAVNSRVINGDRLRSYTSTRQNQQLWLETGEAVASMYSDLREEARDHARVRNAYFEQARQAYLVGNKARAKELSAKGQWHNGLMKAAHGKAGEAIYRQRNTATNLQNLIQGEDRLIDLHGLHVNEAIHVLKNELAVLRNTARSIGQRQLVLICVGTGHHTKGARTPARLPAAVERYLLEDEHLDYTEPQPGMLRVSIF